MAILTFDTLAFSKTMQDAGMDRMQAEALATAQREAFSQMLDARAFATKEDVVETKSELKEDIAAVKADITAVRTELKEDIAMTNASQDALEQAMPEWSNIFMQLSEQLDAKIEIRFKAFENKMVKWLIGCLVAQTTLIFAILSYLRG